MEEVTVIAAMDESSKMKWKSPEYKVEVRLDNIPDCTANFQKWPSWWFRFWTRVFFGARWSKVN